MKNSEQTLTKMNDNETKSVKNRLLNQAAEFISNVPFIIQQQRTSAFISREYCDMPVITYSSNYNSNNHHTMSSASSGHTLPKYSSTTNSSLNNGSIYNFKYRNPGLSSNSRTFTSSSTDNYRSILSNLSGLNKSTTLQTKSRNYLNSSNNYKNYVSTSSLSSTPRSSISHSSISNSSNSSNGSISSYNNTNSSGLSSSSSVTLTSYSPRRSSLINDDFKTSTNSLKPSTSYLSIPSPKWRKKFILVDPKEIQIPKELSGLTNIGNTCYMNSVLQALYSTEPFRKFVLRNPKGSLLNALGKLFQEMNEEKSCVYPGMFRNQFIKYQSKFRGYDQQDAQEFLRYLINGVHDEINQAKYSTRPKNLKSPKNSSEAWEQYKYIDDSPLIDMVAGQLGSTISCTVCEYSSTCYDPFWDLSLSLPSKVTECNIMNCLQDFTAVELLAADELIKCERCKKQTRCTKKLSIVKLPTVLILHIKRFSNEGYKLTNPKIMPEETLVINNKSYNLFSIVCHHGYSSRSGHYTAYCNFKSKWYHFNDDKVTESSKFLPKNCEDAYILLYIDKERDRNYFVSRL